MNLRERLELRAVLRMIVSIIENLVRLFDKAMNKFRPKPDSNPDEPVNPHRPRPLKRVIDTIDNIVPFPLPWKTKK